MPTAPVCQTAICCPPNRQLDCVASCSLPCNNLQKRVKHHIIDYPCWVALSALSDSLNANHGSPQSRLAINPRSHLPPSDSKILVERTTRIDCTILESYSARTSTTIGWPRFSVFLTAPETRSRLYSEPCTAAQNRSLSPGNAVQSNTIEVSALQEILERIQQNAALSAPTPPRRSVPRAIS